MFKISKKTAVQTPGRASLLLFAVFLALIDRILKIFALVVWSHQEVVIWPNIAKFSFQLNPNLSFSLPLGNSAAMVIIAIIILILAIFTIKSLKSADYQLAAPLTIILVCAISNWVDRAIYGGVIDYFYLKFFTIFNLADSAITLSIIYLLLILLKRNKWA